MYIVLGIPVPSPSLRWFIGEDLLKYFPLYGKMMTIKKRKWN